MTMSRRARAPIAVLLWLAACGGGGPDAPDPCAAVGVCDTPPADACAAGSATRALRYPAAGTCTAVAGAASCDYQPTLVDCALTGQVCQAGACVAPPDPCLAAGVCTTPPADACATGDLLLRYASPGQCTPQGGAASCHYPPTQVDCAATGEVCEAGSCVAPPDPCLAPGVCTTPPAPSCASATVALVPPDPGTCTAVGGAASCAYPPAQVDCAATGRVCEAGACVAPPDPCLAPGVCTTPPATTCTSPTVATGYGTPGTCTSPAGQAVCDYPATTTDCALAGQVCQAGACVAPPDPCAAAGVCTSPPADACDGATVRLDYGAAGTCTVVGGAAACAYLPVVVDCAAGGQVCQGGACVAPPDPCAAAGVCNTPPAPTCTTPTTLVTRSAPGLCTAAGGLPVCDYPATTTDCAAGGQVCQGGACVAPPPCEVAGVCTTPPADGCLDATTAQRYASPGTCTDVGGAPSCVYQPSVVDCAATNQACDGGACVDPCAAPGLCTTPPADDCASATVRLDYGAAGTCTAVGGAPSCAYLPAVVDCAASGQVCQGGACVTPPPCEVAGVCTTPPADACLTATTAQRFTSPGTCTEVGGAASCDYHLTLVDCALTGRVCEAGACVVPPDPCAAPDACTSPPADACQGATVRLDYSSPGTCTNQGGTAACAYPPVVVDCASTNQACEAGTCVDPCAAPGLCEAPPPDDCASATVRLDYGATGACTPVGGAPTCEYQPLVVDCDATGLVCEAGACVAPPDPCAAPGVCTTPPADECASARTVLDYPATGTCTNAAGTAACDYSPAQVTCPIGQVCAGGACVTDPCAIPPDGAGFVAYAAWVNGTAGYDLRAVRVDGTCDQPLADGPGDDLDPAWDAATGTLTWGATREGNGRIAVMALADRTPQILDTGLALAAAPTLVPTAVGQLVVFEDRPFGEQDADLRFFNLDRDLQGPFYVTPDHEAGPASTSDGSQVYFVSNRVFGRQAIWRIPPGGGTPTFITFVEDALHEPELIGKPAVSPDGHHLAYARASTTPGSLTKVMIYDVETQEERLLSDQGDSEPAYDATGNTLAVRTSRYGLTDVVLLDVATGAVTRRLTDGTRLVGAPTFPR